MKWRKGKPDPARGPASDDNWEEVTSDSTDIPSSVRRYRSETHGASISLERRFMFVDGYPAGWEAWVELRIDDRDIPVVFGRSDILAADAAAPFLELIDESAVPWREGLNRAFYEAVIGWRGS
jgi:hypothetical protein